MPVSSSLIRWYVAVGLAPCAAAIYYFWSLAYTYRRLPAQVPVHFDLDGSPNGYMPHAVWALTSVLSLAGLAAGLLFATPPGVWRVSTILYWGAIGMVAGAFSEINFSAANQHRFHMLSLLWGGAAVTAAGIVSTLALAFWWRAPR